MNDRLKYLRTEVFKQTQKEFADILGIQVAAYSLIELGQRPLRETYIKLLNYKLNVNEHWLKTGEGDIKTLSPMQSILLGKSEYSDEAIRHFAKVAEYILDRQAQSEER